jgi:phytanoyl-CoA hydroxylase
MHDLDPIYSSFSRTKALADLGHELQLQNHVIIQSMHIFKHAGIGGKVDLHQDSTFLHTSPPSCIGFWFAL